MSTPRRNRTGAGAAPRANGQRTSNGTTTPIGSFGLYDEPSPTRKQQRLQDDTSSWTSLSLENKEDPLDFDFTKLAVLDSPEWSEEDEMDNAEFNRQFRLRRYAAIRAANKERDTAKRPRKDRPKGSAPDSMSDTTSVGDAAAPTRPSADTPADFTSPRRSQPAGGRPTSGGAGAVVRIPAAPDPSAFLPTDKQPRPAKAQAGLVHVNTVAPRGGKQSTATTTTSTKPVSLLAPSYSDLLQSLRKKPGTDSTTTATGPAPWPAPPKVTIQTPSNAPQRTVPLPPATTLQDYASVSELRWHSEKPKDDYHDGIPVHRPASAFNVVQRPTGTSLKTYDVEPYRDILLSGYATGDDWDIDAFLSNEIDDFFGVPGVNRTDSGAPPNGQPLFPAKPTGSPAAAASQPRSRSIPPEQRYSPPSDMNIQVERTRAAKEGNTPISANEARAVAPPPTLSTFQPLLSNDTDMGLGSFSTYASERRPVRGPAPPSGILQASAAGASTAAMNAAPRTPRTQSRKAEDPYGTSLADPFHADNMYYGFTLEFDDAPSVAQDRGRDREAARKLQSSPQRRAPSAAEHYAAGGQSPVDYDLESSMNGQRAHRAPSRPFSRPVLPDLGDGSVAAASSAAPPLQEDRAYYSMLGETSPPRSRTWASPRPAGAAAAPSPSPVKTHRAVAPVRSQRVVSRPPSVAAFVLHGVSPQASDATAVDATLMTATTTTTSDNPFGLTINGADGPRSLEQAMHPYNGSLDEDDDRRGPYSMTGLNADGLLNDANGFPLATFSRSARHGTDGAATETGAISAPIVAMANEFSPMPSASPRAPAPTPLTEAAVNAVGAKPLSARRRSGKSGTNSIAYYSFNEHLTAPFFDGDAETQGPARQKVSPQPEGAPYLRTVSAVADLELDSYPEEEDQRVVGAPPARALKPSTQNRSVSPGLQARGRPSSAAELEFSMLAPKPLVSKGGVGKTGGSDGPSATAMQAMARVSRPASNPTYTPAGNTRISATSRNSTQSQPRALTAIENRSSNAKDGAHPDNGTYSYFSRMTSNLSTGSLNHEGPAGTKASDDPWKAMGTPANRNKPNPLSSHALKQPLRVMPHTATRPTSGANTHAGKATVTNPSNSNTQTQKDPRHVPSNGNTPLHKTSPSTNANSKAPVPAQKTLARPVSPAYSQLDMLLQTSGDSVPSPRKTPAAAPSPSHPRSSTPAKPLPTQPKQQPAQALASFPKESPNSRRLAAPSAPVTRGFQVNGTAYTSDNWSELLQGPPPPAANADVSGLSFASLPEVKGPHSAPAALRQARLQPFMPGGNGASDGASQGALSQQSRVTPIFSAEKVGPAAKPPKKKLRGGKG